MKVLKQTSQFKKDFKRIENNKKKLEAVLNVLDLLAETGIIPIEFNPHMLTGNWEGHMECHIQGDFLLIWLDAENDVIKLERLGSHSELFEKSRK